MLLVTTQDNKNYRIEYFHINKLEDNTYEMVGLARLDLHEISLVHLAYYKFFKQAISVFADMDVKDNDIMYFITNKKYYVMPENITDVNECIAIYGSTY